MPAKNPYPAPKFDRLKELIAKIEADYDTDEGMIVGVMASTFDEIFQVIKWVTADKQIRQDYHKFKNAKDAALRKLMEDKLGEEAMAKIEAEIQEGEE